MEKNNIKWRLGVMTGLNEGMEEKLETSLFNSDHSPSTRRIPSFIPCLQEACMRDLHLNAKHA